MSATVLAQKMCLSEPAVDLTTAGGEMHALVRRLYPICRSITGNGIRETFTILNAEAPLTVHEVPTGTAVFDWTIPREWNIRDAYVKDSTGRRVIDFHKSNLHVLNYSVPIHKMVDLAELKQHLFSLPDRPDWIPYRTSYYTENWGFCISHNELLSLKEGEYEVCIDSTLEPGYLSYAECFLQGAEDEEVLISCHACHPSLCNDNLSGLVVATKVAKYLSQFSTRLSYRFLFIPGTIGSITWLARNEERVDQIRHGLVLTCVGDRGSFTYKKSRKGNAVVDRAFAHILKRCGDPFRIMDFHPYGYDERQYCSPGFDLPVGCLMRSQHGTFPEYHTSADNLDFVAPAALADTYQKVLSLIHLLENNRVYRSLNPRCEPQLGKRGIYRAIGGEENLRDLELAMLWVLNLADGGHSLLDMAERAATDFKLLNRAAQVLLQHGLLEDVSSQSRN
jgi:aminopeptidase-like protein